MRVPLLVLIVVMLLVLLGPVLVSHDPMQTSDTTLQPPSGGHLLGTDLLGRDVLSRALFGGRRTLLIAFLATMLAVVAGTLLGLLAGTVGGKLDATIQGLLNAMLALAARRGLLLSVENHSGSIAQDPSDAERILEDVPGLGLDYDMAHAISNSISLGQVTPLIKHIVHVGVRNAKPGDFNVSTTDLRLDFELGPQLNALRAANVNAYVSVDYFRPSERASLTPLKNILEGAGVQG